MSTDLYIISDVYIVLGIVLECRSAIHLKVKEDRKPVLVILGQ